MKKICKDCGTEFTLSQGEIDFYKSKNFSLPQRCKNCRDKRKQNNSDFEKPYTQKYVPTSSVDKSIFTKIGGIALALGLLIFGIGSEISEMIQQNSASNNYSSSSDNSTYSSNNSNSLQFRSDQYLSEHFAKHGSLLGHSNKESYLSGANNVIQSPSVLHRIQSDGDSAYFLTSTNEFVVVSTDGYIRTYFKPTDGIDYFNRQ